MNKPIGGRGKSVPYNTKLVRIPEPIEHQVSELKSRYYGFVDGGGDPSKPVNWIKEAEVESSHGGGEVLARVTEIVNRWEEKVAGKDVKKNVRYSQAVNLLNELREAIYSMGDS